MKFIADFHIHSKYSRATSKNMDVENLARWAKIKGISLMGTGDFTHPVWLSELKSFLEPADNGLFHYQGVHFILTAEVSSIYSKKGKTYRIHNLIFAPSFKSVDKINRVLSGIGNIVSDGRPILGLDAAELARIVFSIDEHCVIAPAHIWTPWFSLFGSMSGFDLLEDCFEEQSAKIFCLETGLSSDPAMNWRLSALDKYALISNSDSHSPQKIGREANVFDCELSYFEIMDALKNKDKKRFLYTIEFFPEEGKYHFDGHRNCKIRFSPQQTKKHKGLCPECGKRITVGVMNRVDALADRKDGFAPKNAIPFKRLIPLDEIIAEAIGVGKTSKRVVKEYEQVIQSFGTEFAVLLRAPEKELYRLLSARLAQGISRVRSGNVNINPGYDGEYGTVSIFSEDDKDTAREKQLSFFE
ncbi:MAG: endonuclease Q family protein [Candidatus Omnitrophica bacterium]|nr:endonuclease Q family protein [Candidatus Omnitrophota bacterium]MBU4477582.1 endonuclease Q family protein [Candidatus Omnitrophota bacterium]MCG2703610.1 endonuclease Q family protein [Candidatus Omnitrophota bacterium]